MPDSRDPEVGPPPLFGQVVDSRQIVRPDHH